MTGIDDRTPDAWHTAPRADAWHNDGAPAATATRPPPVALTFGAYTQAVATISPRPFGVRSTRRVLDKARLLADQAEDIHEHAVAVCNRGAASASDEQVLKQALGGVLFHATALCRELGITLDAAALADLDRRARARTPVGGPGA